MNTRTHSATERTKRRGTHAYSHRNTHTPILCHYYDYYYYYSYSYY